MTFKKWWLKPYWVKGVLIGLIILLAYGLNFLFCIFSHPLGLMSGGGLGCIIPPLSYISYSENIAAKLLVGLGFNAPQGSTLLNSLSVFFGLFFLFSPVIIGAVIGWIVEKIKKLFPI